MNSNLLLATSVRLERYESKFVIPESLVEDISEFVASYCSLDKHSVMADDHYYRVNNLYFDTPNYLFLHRRLSSVENRFNMRVRTYSDYTTTPCFFEIKQKKVNVIRKYRAYVDDPNWVAWLENLEFPENGNGNNGGNGNHDGNGSHGILCNRGLFLQLAMINQAAPKVLTQYRRKAYVSDINDYARVTFDRELRYRPENGYDLIPGDNRMIPLDNCTLFDSGCDIIIELKCYSTHVPLWMMDLIKVFDLRRRSFSKYVTGISEVLQRDDYYRYCRHGMV